MAGLVSILARMEVLGTPPSLGRLRLVRQTLLQVVQEVTGVFAAEGMAPPQLPPLEDPQFQVSCFTSRFQLNLLPLTSSVAAATHLPRLGRAGCSIASSQYKIPIREALCCMLQRPSQSGWIQMLVVLDGP